MIDNTSRELRIVDAHVHVVERLAGYGPRGESVPIGRGRVRWANGEEAKLIPNSWGSTTFTHDKLVEVLNHHGVDKAIMLQGSLYGFCNDYTYEAQKAHPGRLFGMGTFDPYAVQASTIMRRLAHDYQFKGFKFEISASFGLTGYHPDFRLDSEYMMPVWTFAQKEGMVVSLDLGTFGEPSMQLDALKSIAERHNGIRFVVEHLFYPGHGHFEDIRKALAELSACENICFTLAALPNSVLPEPYPFESASRYIGIARDVIGAHRLLWGSDIPSVAVSHTYRELIDYVAASGLFSEDELRGVFAENAARVYNL